MLPTNTPFDIEKLDMFTKKEKQYYESWVTKAIEFINGSIDATEIKYMTRIVENMIKVQYKRAANAQLLWRMKTHNEKELHNK